MLSFFSFANDILKSRPTSRSIFIHAPLDYRLQTVMVKSMIENMLNARLNELTQTANPPFIFAQVSDQEFLISKTKDAFTGIVASSCKQGNRRRCGNGLQFAILSYGLLTRLICIGYNLVSKPDMKCWMGE